MKQAPADQLRDSVCQRGSRLMQNPALILLSIVVLVASGCSGGGSGNNNNNNQNNGTNPPPPGQGADEDANGIWEGIFHENNLGTFGLIGLLYEGEIFAVRVGANQAQANAIYRGEYDVSGDDISAEVSVYGAGGEKTGQAVLRNGRVTAQSQIAMIYDAASAGVGSISLFYNPIYERDSSLSRIAGNYVSETSDYTLSLSITGAGSLSGFDSQDCEFSGQVSLLDVQFNLYELALSVSSCDSWDGEFSGFAVLFDDAGPDSALTVMLANDAKAVFGDMIRQ